MWGTLKHGRYKFIFLCLDRGTRVVVWEKFVSLCASWPCFMHVDTAAPSRCWTRKTRWATCVTLASLFSPVLSGLCFNNCPDDVKVRNLSDHWPGVSLWVNNPRVFIFFQNQQFFSRDRETCAVISWLLVKLHVYREEELYIQQNREGDLNWWCVFQPSE